MVGPALASRGWEVFADHPATRAWATAAHRVGCAVASDPAMQAEWLQCDGTWFVGVDALPTAPDGSIDGIPLAGPAIDALAPLPALHPAQLSITYPGYPRPRAGESDAAFAYRRNRDAAHIDGLIGHGQPPRRFVEEPHAFILGLPLTDCGAGASPLVVWDGSHRIMRSALAEALAGHPPADWGRVDVTDAYVAARKQVFDTCERIELFARPGQALLLHRLMLHGVAPWQPGAAAPAEGRMIAYFRPPVRGGVEVWIGAHP